MKLTTKTLYEQIVSQIEKRQRYPKIESWEKQLSTTQVHEPVRASGFDPAEILNVLMNLLEDIVPANIKSGLMVTASDPITDEVIISEGTGSVGARIYTLKKSVTAKIPFDVDTYLFYINLYQDGIKVERTMLSNQLTLAKIIVPKPRVTSLVQDSRDDSWNAYIVNLKEYKLYGDADGNFEEDTIDLLRDNIGAILADNLIGNIKLTEDLTIRNTAGTLELDSEEQRWLDEDGNILAKFNRRGTFFYDINGREMARFTANDARIGNIKILKDAIQSDNFVAGSIGFRIKDDGDVEFRGGTIGNFTIINDKLYGGTIQTGANVGLGQTGVVMDSAGLRGYDSVLGLTFNIPTDGSRPIFSSGKITETEIEITTGAVMRTSSTVGDGSSDSAGILINATGLYGCEANQLLENANFKVLTDGTIRLKGEIEATRGNIGGVTIESNRLVGGTIEGATLRGGILETSETVPKIRIDDTGIYFQEVTETGKYGGVGSGMFGFQYGDGVKYGTGLLALLFRSGYPLITMLREWDLADIRLYDRQSDPGSGTGPHAKGDIILVNGKVKVCTAAGSPGTFTSVGVGVVGTGGGHIVIEPFAYSAIGQGTWGWGTGSNFYRYGYLRNAVGAADEDNLSYTITLATGTYTLLIIGHKNDSFAIMDIDIDDTEVASFDEYVSGSEYNVLFEETNINITEAGIKTLKVRVDGRNGSSSGWIIGFSAIIIYQTA